MNRFKIFLGLTFIILAAIIGAGSTPFSKFALREISPLSFTLFRFAIASIFIIPWLFFQKARLKFSEIRQLVLISALSTANTMLSIFGTERTTAISVQTLYTAVPLVVAVFAWWILKDKLTIKKIAGLLIGFIGVMILILQPIIEGHSVFAGDLTGNLIIAVAIISFALYVVLSKSLHKHYSPFLLMAVYIFTTLFAQILILPFFGQYVNPFLISSGTWLAILYTSVMGTVGYYLVYQYAIKDAGPVAASTILYIQPAVTAIWAFFLLGEHLTLWLVIGGLISLIGVGVVSREKSSVSSVEKVPIIE